jgi:hypothetical protein
MSNNRASRRGIGVARKLWKFQWDCGRQGVVTGIFAATQEEVTAAIGRHVYFGEVLGKHSEIFGDLDENDITEIIGTQEHIKWLIAAFGATKGIFLNVPSESITITGHNPLQHLREASE